MFNPLIDLPFQHSVKRGIPINQVKRKDKWNDLFEIGLYALAAACLVYFTIRGNRAKLFEPVLTVVVLVIIRGVVRLTKTVLFPALRFSILLFIFMTMFVANEFGFYSVIPYLDKAEHLFSGVILCFVGLVIYKKASEDGETAHPSAKAGVWFSLFFSVAMAGVWEIYEFTTDRLFGLDSQNGSLVDTMTDIICGTIGAVFTAVYLACKAKNKRLPLIDAS
jgi:uncharacterized membrane protein YjdF